nr:unnamed protein product [Callosobruchus analis]
MHRRLTDDYPMEKYKETKLLQNMITVYLPQLRHLYEKYAAITVNEEHRHTLNFKPVMVRLFLWQLLRDIDMQRFISLVDYDNFMYANPCSCYEFAAWKYYLSSSMNSGDISVTDMVPPETAVKELGTGLISKLFKRFLQHVIPNSGTITGTALTKYKDLVPLDGAYNLYLSLGEPHTVNMFLYSSCPKEGVQIPCYIGIQPDCEPIKEGFNATLLGDKPSYIDVKCSPLEKIVEKDRCRSPEGSKSSDEFYRSLYAFRNLGRTTILKCIRKVCPMVDKRKSFNYKLTFLEFYEILFECVHCKVNLLKEAARENLKMTLIEKAIHKSPSECTSLSKGSKGKKGKGSSRKSLQL